MSFPSVSRWVLPVLSGLILLAPAVNRAADEPKFGPHPRLATTPAEYEQLQKSPGFSAIRSAAIARGDALVKTPPIVPEGAGNWTFYYACPDHSCDLQPKSLTEHICPQCEAQKKNRVFTDERTVASYRTRLYDQANIAAEALGWAYLYSGDNKYALGVQKILLKLADAYPHYPPRHDRWGRTGMFARLGGRRDAQSLDEAVGVIHLAKAYDLTYNSSVWTDEQKKHVDKDLFRQVAETLLDFNQGINNHQAWYNGGLMCIANALGDKDLMNKILTMRGGFYDQVKRSMGDNGFWYEGSMAYHNYALQAMKEVIDAGRRAGVPLHEEPRIKAMILAPLRYAYPNGQFPAINDSDAGHISSFNNSFEWAWNLYHDQRFARAVAQTNEAKLKEMLGPDAKVTYTIDPTSVDLPDAGLVALRRGAGANATCVMVDYGEHGGGHGHFDKLNIVVFANGREWLVDPGRLTYSHKEYLTWVKTTAAHNTVSLGGRTQSATTGKVLWFQPNEQYAACGTQSDGAYPGAVLTRYLLLADSLLVDVFDVSSKDSKQIDWFAHAISEKLQPVENMGPGETASPGNDYGYQHLADGRKWSSSSPTQWDFVSPKPDPNKLRLWIAGTQPETLFSCKGIGHYIESKVPCLIRRVQGNHARFVTVYDLSGTGSHVTVVRNPAGEDAQVNVETKSGAWNIFFSKTGVKCTLSGGK
jgi:hypothetical protein